ncbi:MAG: hypothetical protein MUF64_28425 [Polyangiaceae bacterium]|jgi:hypothetical protein|nr:hypothetical protein [Polyangiaceae bacterium]
MEQSAKMKVVWLITERNDRSYWTRIGVGTVNKDGSINLSLSAVPVGNGRIQVRDYTPRDAEQHEGPPPPSPRAARHADAAEPAL